MSLCMLCYIACVRDWTNQHYSFLKVSEFLFSEHTQSYVLLDIFGISFNNPNVVLRNIPKYSNCPL